MKRRPKVAALQAATNDKEFSYAHPRPRPRGRHPDPARDAQRRARRNNGYYQGQHLARLSGPHCAASRPNGTTGLIVGAAGGALIGRAIDTRGERTTGTVIGAAAGALLGRQIERSRKVRCR